ncbi:putative non-specific serine/threonine protein kinase [Helianthus annuus]|nr:putative non-specific serine/threonine protein kinase [Helianthus annuus]KAJ0756925.1 putative non-specific serine/threonine protein kinase [Helianthus annuus]KAJ0760659.1 putative non-specific serine/threonine protein kinase [Helianthus annuus]
MSNVSGLLVWIIRVIVSGLLVFNCKGLNSDGLFLLELKKNITDELNYLKNWNPSDDTPCGWTGVNCTYDYTPPVREAFVEQ